MRAQPTARIHRFHDQIAISFTDSVDTLYLTPEMAASLADELKHFAENSTGKDWPATRIVDATGYTVNEVDGKTERVNVP